jgi:hypothetical protein
LPNWELAHANLGGDFPSRHAKPPITGLVILIMLGPRASMPARDHRDDAVHRPLNSPADHRYGLLLIVLSGVGLALRLYRLEHHALWADEANRLIWAEGHSVQAQLFGVTASETAMRVGVGTWLDAFKNAVASPPPLFGILIHPWLSLGPILSDAFVRLPCALFSAAAVPLTYVAAKEVVPPRAALYASGLLALAPMHVFWGQQFSYYPLAYCCVLVSCFFYFRFLETRASRDGAAWAIASAISVYAHTFCGVVFACQVLAMFARTKRPRLWPAALAALLLVPQIVLMFPALFELRHVTHDFSSQPSVLAFANGLAAVLVQPYLGEYTSLLSAYALHGLAALAAVFVVIGGLLVPTSDQRRTLFINTCGPVAVFAACYALSGANVFTWPRYYFFFGFSVSLCVALALASLRRLAVPILAALAVGAAVAHHHQYFQLVKEDWWGVARAIESAHAPNQPVFVQRYNLVNSLGRYLHANNPLFGVLQQSDVASVPEHTLQHGGAWFVDVWTFGQAIAVDELKRRFASCSQWDVPSGSWGMTLTRCDNGTTVSRVEQGFFEGKRDGCLIGWAFSSVGLRELRVVHARGAILAQAQPQGLLRTDVASVFANLPFALTSQSGFKLCIEESGGDPTLELLVLAVRHDGTFFQLNTADSPAMRQ